MDNPVRPGTDLKHAPACCRQGPVPFPAALLIALCLAGVSAHAETPLKNSFGTAEMKLMAEANLAYTGCLQNHAREHMASSPDVRVVAGNAAEACNSVLEELDNTLTDRGINPAFYMGAITRIKNRAIRRVLPLLMMEKSSQGS
ncbi:MAG: hypothetical protein OXG54_12255 [Gammaproteobacteria bacterium]|nr:hypothetical protein [Gammaproteobacteria bacterium]